MTNPDKVLEALRQCGPLSDAELVEAAGVRPHQQVNQICRRLEGAGVLRRERNPAGVIYNVLDENARAVRASTPTKAEGVAAATTQAAVALTDSAASRLMVLPCSAKKQTGGVKTPIGPTLPELLPNRLADRLRQARRVVGCSAALDESRWLPAWQRYAGSLYDVAGPALGTAIGGGAKVVIISGGYGIVLGQEPIGHYDRCFKMSDWPPGLLAECLASTTEALGVTEVRAFCARTTSYAQFLRSVTWRRFGLQANLISPRPDRRGGAQVLVPRATGEAIVASIDNRFNRSWRTDNGTPMVTEALP